MRDPLNNEKTAFEFFSRDMNLPHQEVLKAYNEFIRNPKNARKRTEARKKMDILRDPRSRLQHDIKLYDLTAPDEVEEIPYDFVKPECELPKIKPEDLGDAFDLLEIPSDEETKLAAIEREPEIIYVGKFHDVEKTPLSLPLDF